MRIRRIITSILLFLTCFLIAEDDNSMEIISVSQGLPNSRINRVFLGGKGLIWIGTSNGLCFYDGYNFNIKQSVPFDTTTLADDNIRDIAQNKNLDIWLLTNFGVEILRPLTGEARKVLQIRNPKEIVGLVSSAQSTDVFLVSKNCILRIRSNDYEIDTVFKDNTLTIKGVTIEDNIITMLETHALIQFNVNTYESDSYKLHKRLNVGESQVVIGWNEENAIYTNHNKLFIFNFIAKRNTRIFEASGPILSLSQRVGNILSVATEKEVFQLNFSNGIDNIRVNQLYTFAGFNNAHILQDNNHLNWVGTNRGILKLNPHSHKIEHLPIPLNYIENHRLKDLVFETTDLGLAYKTIEGINFIHSVNNTTLKLPLSSCNAITLIDKDYYLIGDSEGLLHVSIDGKEVKRIGLFNKIRIHAIKEKDGNVWISTSSGLYKGINSTYELICDKVFNDFILYDELIYFTSDLGFGELDLHSCSSNMLLTGNSKGEPINKIDMLQSLDRKIWIATHEGLYQFNPNAAQDDDKDHFKLVYNGTIFSLIEAKNLPEIWFATDLGIGAVNYQNKKVMLLGYEDGVRQTSFIPGGAFYGKEGKLNFLTQDEVVSFFPDSIFRNKNIPNIIISQVNLIGEKYTTSHLLYVSDTLLLLPKTRFLELSFSTLDFFAPLHTAYEYSLTSTREPLSWNKLEGNTLSLGGLTPGVYNLNVRARNSHGVMSDRLKKIKVIVKAPPYLSKLAILLYGVLLIAIVISLIHIRTRNLSRINKEYKEKERIAKKIEQQKEELTLKNKNITDSINYARRIQLAMMPSIRLFNTIFPDSFILHMPKDIVSGDFYWVNHVKNKIFFSAVDCTGHGVPGAFMSIIGVELFRRITEIEKIYTPAEVLNSLSKNFERVFGDVDEMKLRDGMDLAFCSLNEEHTILEYSGAFNPLYIIRDSSIMEIKGDRHSVGVYEEDDDVRSFNNHVIPVRDGDIIYIFTDGFVDQFGGPEGKKYKYRRFRHLLLALHQLPMEKQEEFLRKSILEWKGEQDQVDDILVMGLRIHQNL